jgi:hypothetical protein
MSRLFGQPDGLLVIISKPPYEKEKLSVLCISYFKLYAMKKFQFSSQLTFYFPFSFPARHAISILHFIISTLLHFWGIFRFFSNWNIHKSSKRFIISPTRPWALLT